MAMRIPFLILFALFSVGAGLFAGLKALTLPAIALALPQASILARVMRSSLIDTLGQDYIRTARAKGLSRRLATRRHALRNAMIPVLTIMGLQFSFLMAGAIIIGGFAGGMLGSRAQKMFSEMTLKVILACTLFFLFFRFMKIEYWI